MEAEYRFCPHCGHGLAPRPAEHDAGRNRPTCDRCGYIYYANPKVAAGALFIYEGGYLLTRRAIEPGRGLWVFPGGYVDRGETLEDAAVRETREEVGLEVAVQGLLGAFSFTGSPVVVAVFRARVTGGRLQLGPECLEAASYAPDRIPWDQLAFPSTRRALECALGAGSGIS